MISRSLCLPTSGRRLIRLVLTVSDLVFGIPRLQWFVMCSFSRAGVTPSAISKLLKGFASSSSAQRVETSFDTPLHADTSEVFRVCAVHRFCEISAVQRQKRVTAMGEHCSYAFLPYAPVLIHVSYSYCQL